MSLGNVAAKPYATEHCLRTMQTFPPPTEMIQVTGGTTIGQLLKKDQASLLMHMLDLNNFYNLIFKLEKYETKQIKVV